MRTARPRYFKLDQSAAATIGEAALMFGNDSFGADMMKPLVVKELGAAPSRGRGDGRISMVQLSALVDDWRRVNPAIPSELCPKQQKSSFEE